MTVSLNVVVVVKPRALNKTSPFLLLDESDQKMLRIYHSKKIFGIY